MNYLKRYRRMFHSNIFHRCWPSWDLCTLIYFRLFEEMNPDLVERDAFLNRALQWSCTGLAEYKTGHPNLHKRFAEIFWRRTYCNNDRALLIRMWDFISCSNHFQREITLLPDTTICIHRTVVASPRCWSSFTYRKVILTKSTFSSLKLYCSAWEYFNFLSSLRMYYFSTLVFLVADIYV